MPSLPASTIGSLLDLGHWSRLRLFVDGLVLCAAAAGALVGAGGLHSTDVKLWLAIAYAVLVVAILSRRELRDDRFRASLFDTLAHVLSSVTVTGVMIIALAAMSGTPHPARVGLGLSALAGAALAIERTGLMYGRRAARRGPGLASPTLIIGAGVIGGRLAQRLQADRSFGLRPVGFLDADPLPRRRASDDPRAVPVLGAPADLAAAVAQTGARHVILAFSTEPDSVLLGRVQTCQALGLAVSLVPRLYEAIDDRATLDHVAGMPLLTLHAVNSRGSQFGLKQALDHAAAVHALSSASHRASKRLFDVVFAGTLLALLVPLFAMIAAAVKLDSPGSVFYRVRRVGYQGRPLMMLKFRKMYDDAAGGPLTADKDPRLTRIGALLVRSRLDELPQLWDVLRGRMSIVGPRPEDPAFVALHRADYERILSVRPGMTGLAQLAYAEESRIVDADNPIDDYVARIMPQKLLIDKMYAGGPTLGLDLSILRWTLVTVLLRRPVAVSRSTGQMSVRRRPSPSQAVAIASSQAIEAARARDATGD